ncbi:hypothetical protein GCM10011607_28690 [Shewanella inventionis]|uniref:S-layer family protein n=1 Tax=Shewanella inventionis TaxID=1738770 RepID=A0ABQ1JH94_9GAMM|nr:hypothetical protein [Shewanella inventionis]GGB66277.1 hypothetical protein GCM10011607_28690 [Shewanella inventionis]
MKTSRTLYLSSALCLLAAAQVSADPLNPSGIEVTKAPSSSDIANERIDKAKAMFEEVEAAALNDYVNSGTWSSSLNVMASQGKYLGKITGPYGKNFEFVPQSDGTTQIKLQVDTAAQAKQIANLIGNGVASGTTVIKTVGTPAEGALRNSLLADYVDIDSTSKLKYQVDVDLNGNDLNNVNLLSTNSLNIGSGGVDLGTTSIKETSSGQLAFNANTTRFSKNLDVAGTLSANDLTVSNKITANTGEITTLNATTANINNLIGTNATVTNADIDDLIANTAKFQSAAAQTLQVSGLTTLANLVANKATFNGLVKSGSLQLSGSAVVNTLEAQGVTVENATITKAEVINLVSALANITTVYSDLVDTRQVISNYGQINDLYGVTADINSLVSNIVTAQTFDVTTLKALNSELQTATANTLSVLGSANIKSLTAETGVIKVLASDLATIKDLKSTTLTNTGKLTTGTLQVNSDANIKGNMTVAKKLTSKDLSVTNSATISGTTTTNTLRVNSNADIVGTTTTGNLSVTNNATAGTLNATTINTTDANVTNNLNTKNLTASGSMGIAGSLTSNSLATGNATINGKLVTQQLEAQVGEIATLNTTNANVSNNMTTRDLVVTSLATLNAANISNLVSTISSIGTASGSTLALTGDISAKNASLNSLDVSGKGSFGSIVARGDSSVTGNFTVGSNLTASSANITGTLTASNANLGTTTANTVTATGVIQGSDVQNNSGVSLNALKTGYDAHGNRIVTMEKWIADCKSKAVAECNR